MVSIVDIVAIIPPKPDKLQRAIELLEGMATKTHERESGALRYSIHKELNASPGQEGVDIVMIEHYKDVDAQKLHLETEYFQEFAKTLQAENLLRGELMIKVVQQIGGFAGR